MNVKICYYVTLQLSRRDKSGDILVLFDYYGLSLYVTPPHDISVKSKQNRIVLFIVIA